MGCTFSEPNQQIVECIDNKCDNKYDKKCIENGQKGLNHQNDQNDQNQALQKRMEENRKTIITQIDICKKVAQSNPSNHVIELLKKLEGFLKECDELLNKLKLLETVNDTRKALHTFQEDIYKTNKDGLDFVSRLPQNDVQNLNEIPKLPIELQHQFLSLSGYDSGSVKQFKDITNHLMKVKESKADLLELPNKIGAFTAYIQIYAQVNNKRSDSDLVHLYKECERVRSMTKEDEIEQCLLAIFQAGEKL